MYRWRRGKKRKREMERDEKVREKLKNEEKAMVVKYVMGKIGK